MMAMALSAAPVVASAETFVTPFAGINFGGAAGKDFEDSFDKGSPFTWGAQVGWMGAGVIGAELDFAYSKNFFGDFGDLGDNSVTTLMPNVIVGIPIGGQRGLGIRPYVTAGVGMIRRRMDVTGFDVVKDNSAGYSLGAGVMGYFGTHLGLRGDYRYIRNFDDDNEFAGIDVSPGTFHYNRASLGLVVKF
jgi:opacity protein-like surface antigen